MATLFNGSGPAVKRIIGTKLQRKQKKISRSFRAVWAAEWVAGELSLTHGSPRQAASTFDVPMGDVRAYLRATPLEREAIKRKRLTIEALRRQQRRNHRPSEAGIDRFIERAGANRVLDRLDHLTCPNKEPVSNGHAAANDNDMAALPQQLSL
jgi:hypothetical protein